MEEALTQNTSGGKLLLKSWLNFGHLLSELVLGLFGLLVQLIESLLLGGSLKKINTQRLATHT